MRAQANHQGIDTERQRQIDIEGFDATHDKQHTPTTFIRAAMCYAMEFPEDKATLPEFWPESWDVGYWKPKERKRNLERSGALLLAAVDAVSRELNKLEEKQ